MPVYEVTGKNGHKYEVTAADDQQAKALEQAINANVAKGDHDLRKARLPFGAQVVHEQRQPASKKPKGKVDVHSVLEQGLTFGLGDEIAGGLGAAVNAIRAPLSSKVDFDPSGEYKRWRDRVRGDVAATRAEKPWASTTAEVVGSIATPMGVMKAPRTLLGAVKSGAKAGGLLGGLAGFGYGEGAEGSMAGAGIGAAAGGLLGAGLPLAAKMVERPVRAAADFISPRSGVGREVVARAMDQDNISPRVAGEMIQQAQDRGVPLALMDLGDNLRGLAGAVSRKPGKSRTLVRDSVIGRQAGQSDRVLGAIGRDLGPIINPAQQSDDLIRQARAAADPLYKKAYATPGRTSPDLEELLATPAGRQALSKARTIAANERRDPNALGFGLDGQGETILESVPSSQTLDYVKRGLDDILEPYRNPITRRLELDEGGRAIDDVRKSLIREADVLNTDYAVARAAYQGPARERQALESGRKALQASADDLERMMNGLSPSELDQFALGHRAAMAEALNRKTDGADKINTLLGTPRKRAALAKLYGGDENFNRFVATMGDENAAFETYRTVNTGSPTAGRMLDDAVIEDPSLLEDVAGRAVRGGRNGLTGLAAEAFGLLKDWSKFGAGKAGERAREDAAALLSEVDPALLTQALRQALKEQAKRKGRDRSTLRIINQVGGLGARGTGAVSGTAATPSE